MNKRSVFFLMLIFLTHTGTSVFARNNRRSRRKAAANQNMQLAKADVFDAEPALNPLSEMNKALDVQDAKIPDNIVPEKTAEKIAEEKNDKAIMDEINSSILEETGSSGGIDEIEVKNEEDEDRVEFQFENTDLFNVIQQIADIFNTTIITDDILNPVVGKATKGFKISFRTNEPMTREGAWNLFTNFLDIAGFSIISDKVPQRWRVIALDKAFTAAVPSYVGVDPSVLPDNQEVIRYVYFVENSDVNTLADVVKNLKSASGRLYILNDLKGLILVDRAYNIKVLMKVVKELDKISMPQAMSVLKLKRIEAKDVEDLYKDLYKKIVGGEEGRVPTFPGQRKQSSALYFPDDTRVIAEPRTNSLILLGTPEAIAKIEVFVKDNLDKEPERPYSPLYHIDIRFADATTLADIITNAVKFGEGTTVAQVGGVRGSDRYFKPSFKCIADKSSNRLIIRGDYEEYLAVVELVKKLDRAPRQVAVEVLIVTIDLNDTKALGAQLRNQACAAWNSVVGPTVNFQTSGFDRQGIVTNDNLQGSQRLLGDLINLAKGLAAGNSVLTLGSDIVGGVWGIMRVLESFTNSQVVSNPFVMACNKQPAKISVGEIRRVLSSIVQGSGDPTNSFSDDEATLTVAITPQINSDGKILLDLDVSIEAFTSDPSASTTQSKSKRAVKTQTMVSDKEVLALGGLIQNRKTDLATKVPLLGDIPGLGWLFKNRSQNLTRSNLLILISTSLIDPEEITAKESFTKRHVDDYLQTVTEQEGNSRDPVNRWFFKDKDQDVAKRTEEFIFKKPKKRQNKILESEGELITQTEPNAENPVDKTKSVSTAVAAVQPQHKNRRISLVDDSENEQEGVA